MKAGSKVAEIKNQQVRALNQILDRADQSKRDLDRVVTEAREARGVVSENAEALKAAIDESDANCKKVAEIAAQADKLANGHARQGSLESLVRIARTKVDEVEGKLAEANASADAAGKASNEAGTHLLNAEKYVRNLQSSDERALQILNNATQAGLAGSYKTEREHLKKQQDRFALIFYGIIAAVIIYAAVFLLPIVKEIFGLDNTQGASAKESAELLLVRLLLLAPAVWALIFTNRRYVNLEALQMDYAAKAATALAYSGYRDEMAEDPELSKRLKDGLLIRFLEHPSRLLKNGTEDDLATALRRFNGKSEADKPKNEGQRVETEGESTETA